MVIYKTDSNWMIDYKGMHIHWDTLNGIDYYCNCCTTVIPN